MRNHIKRVFSSPAPAPGVPTFRTVCMIPNAAGQPCGAEFVEVSFNGVVGTGVDKQLEKFVHRLIEHMGKQHPEQIQVIQQMAARFFGFMVLRSFQTEDSRVQREAEEFAFALRQMSAPQISDDEMERGASVLIEHHVSKRLDEQQVAEVKGLLVQPVADALRNLRDFMAGKIKPKQQEAEADA